MLVAIPLMGIGIIFFIFGSYISKVYQFKFCSNYYKLHGRLKFHIPVVLGKPKILEFL